MRTLLLALTLLAAPAIADCAITEVPSQRASGGTCNDVNTCTAAFPNNVAAGNLLVVGGATWDDPGSGSVTVTDTIGTAYTTVLCTTMDSGRQNTYYAYGIAPSSGANTVTVDPSGASANYIRVHIDEFTGTAASPFSVDGGNSTGTSTSPSDSITTATANELLLALVGVASTAVTTPDGAYTQIGETEGALRGNNFVFRIVTTATSYTPAWTLGVSSAWVACSASFKEPTTGRRRIAPLVAQ